MSRLRLFADLYPAEPRFSSTDGAVIAEKLGAVGVRFERWPTRPLPSPFATEAVLAAYRQDIERLLAQEGYQSFDIVSMAPTHPDKSAMRQKFLDEHTHGEDEVRFFVAGKGLFTLHIGAEIYEVLCEQGDLIGVPALTRHWFDMGSHPSFVAIRLFNNSDGWIATYTGSDIAQRFPRFD